MLENLCELMRAREKLNYRDPKHLKDPLMIQLKQEEISFANNITAKINGIQPKNAFRIICLNSSLETIFNAPTFGS